MKKGFVSLRFFVFLSVYIYGCGSSESKEYLPSPYKPSVPFVSVEPPSGSVIQPDEPIVLQFNESMKTDISISGTMASEVSTSSWDTYLFNNDRDIRGTLSSMGADEY